MFCLLCRKHDVENPKNKSKIFNQTASVRYRTEALHGKNDHSESEQHETVIQAEFLQRGSTFEKELNERRSHQEEIVTKAFSCIYWVEKEEVSNEKFASLLSLIENLGLNKPKLFEHRSRPSVRDMFLLLGNVIKDSVLDKVREGSVFGLLADEATDISVKAQLLMFVKYLDTETETVHGVAKTDFLGVENLLEGEGAEGANADVIFNCLVNQMQKCGLDAEKMTSFVSDGASVVTGQGLMKLLQN